MSQTTQANAWHVSEAELRQWLDELIAGGSAVVAPVVEDEGLLLYGEISAAADAVLEPSGKTRWSPKEFLVPRTETLYRYRFGGAGFFVSCIYLDGYPLDGYMFRSLYLPYVRMCR